MTFSERRADKTPEYDKINGSEKNFSPSDTDGFWDMENLLPPSNAAKKTGKSAVGRPGSDQKTSPAQKAGSAAASSLGKIASARSFSLPETAFQKPGAAISSAVSAAGQNRRLSAAEPYLHYRADGLIRQVKVSLWPSPYSFYEQFLRLAEELFDECRGECKYTPFFSFVPQYQQMSSAQLHYYLWWRENLRRGVCLPTDFCYILLLLYEILNLPHRLPPKEGVRLMAFVWSSYRDKFPRLDKYLGEWFCDYCLIHRISYPREMLAPFLAQFLPHVTLKEFYMGFVPCEEEEQTEAPGAASVVEKDFLSLRSLQTAAMLELSSGYHFRKSKYYTPKTKPLFEALIPPAMENFLAQMREKDLRFSSPDDVQTMQRDSYTGAVCAFRCKRHLELRYLPVSGAKSLSGILTDAVKYCENAVREALHIRARFRTANLTEEMRAILDAYFALHLPASPKADMREASGDAASAAANDTAYEPLSSGISVEDATRIERDSRKAAAFLTVEETDEEEIGAKEPAAPLSAFAEAEKGAEGRKAAVEDLPRQESLLSAALRCLFENDRDGFQALARTHNLLPAALTEQINAAALERLFDIVLIEGETGPEILEDYREEVAEWLKKS